MKVYVTKYALTAGIEVAEVKSSSRDDKYVYTKQGSYGFQQFVMGKDAFLTYGDAVVAARAVRDKKLASLMKQSKKVSSLLFPTAMPNKLRNSL